MDTIKRRLHILALTFAVISTLGSLNFSINMGLFPCRLCWYQRILMYPIVVIVLVGLFEGHDVKLTVLSLTIPGTVIAIYHSYIQIYEGAFCSFGCSTVQFELFGFLTIPNLSAIGFSLITITMLVTLYYDARINVVQ